MEAILLKSSIWQQPKIVLADETVQQADADMWTYVLDLESQKLPVLELAVSN
jgi:hypothetical protein